MPFSGPRGTSAAGSIHTTWSTTVSLFTPTDSDLITDRLALRIWSPEQVSAVTGGARSASWADDFPTEGDRVIAGFIAEDPGNRLGAYGQRQIIERASGLVIGAIGLFWPPADRSVEIGYGVVPSRRGLGIAPEAVRGLAEFALAAPGVGTVHAEVEPANPASVRVLEKAGFERGPAGPETVRYVLTAGR
jgi:[ribosomal protein S5]-alanine N-acetyltransferase